MKYLQHIFAQVFVIGSYSHTSVSKMEVMKLLLLLIVFIKYVSVNEGVIH